MTRNLLLLIPVLFKFASWGAPPVVKSVVNGASFSSSVPVAPGSIISIFGDALASAEATAPAPLPTSLTGISVTVGGLRVPLFYVGPRQINAQLPYETPTGVATLVVSGPDGSSAPFSFRVAATGPGVFLWSTNRAIAQNQDWALNTSSRPAKLGEYITVYLTGIGQLDNPVATASPAPASPLSRPRASVRATIAGADAEVQFLGLTPGFVGLAQANIRIPAIPAGDYPLTIAIGGVTSNSAIVSVRSTVTEYRLTSNPVKNIPVKAGRLKNGDIFFTWAEWKAGTNYYPNGCWAQVYSQDGSPRTSKFKLDSEDSWDYCYATAVSDGGFVAAFGEYRTRQRCRVRKFDSRFNFVQGLDLPFACGALVAELNNGTIVLEAAGKFVLLDGGLRITATKDHSYPLLFRQGISALVPFPFGGFLATTELDGYRFDNDANLVARQQEFVGQERGYWTGRRIACNSRGELWKLTDSFYEATTPRSGLYLQRYSIDGVRLGGPYFVRESLPSGSDYATLAVTDEDSVVVAWCHGRTMARLFGPQGAAQTEAFESVAKHDDGAYPPGALDTIGARGRLFFTSLRFESYFEALYVTIHSSVP